MLVAILAPTPVHLQAAKQEVHDLAAGSAVALAFKMRLHSQEVRSRFQLVILLALVPQTPTTEPVEALRSAKRG